MSVSLDMEEQTIWKGTMVWKQTYKNVKVVSERMRTDVYSEVM